MRVAGRLGFRGTLGIKLIRANRPTRKQRFWDFVARVLGRYST